MRWCCVCVFVCASANVESRGGRHKHPEPFLFELEWMWSKKCDVIKIIKVKTRRISRTKKWHFFSFSLSFALVASFAIEIWISSYIFALSTNNPNWIHTMKRCIRIIQLHVCNSHNILGDLIMDLIHASALTNLSGLQFSFFFLHFIATILFVGEKNWF